MRAAKTIVPTWRSDGLEDEGGKGVERGLMEGDFSNGCFFVILPQQATYIEWMSGLVFDLPVLERVYCCLPEKGSTEETLCPPNQAAPAGSPWFSGRRAGKWEVVESARGVFLEATGDQPPTPPGRFQPSEIA